MGHLPYDSTASRVKKIKRYMVAPVCSYCGATGVNGYSTSELIHSARGVCSFRDPDDWFCPVCGVTLYL